MARIELQYFYGGHLHNTLITASELLSQHRPGITEYRWTQGLLVGSESGRQARVWMHESVQEDAAKDFLASLTR